MRFILLLVLSLGLALSIGAWSADWALEESAEFGTVDIGPWSANPLAGAVDADPYAKARLASVGNLTLGIGEGVLFRAEEDSQGQRLRRQCTYRLEGQTPPARVWTLAAYTPGGRLVQPGTGRPGWLVSGNLMRADDNSFVVTVGPQAAPGNWLALSGEGEFVLAITLYDSPASSSTGLGDLTLPGIQRIGCLDG